MKKITLLAFALLSLCKVSAQVAEYQFEQFNSGYEEIIGTELAVATGSSYVLSIDDFVYPVELPFAFSFNGVSYTNCTVSSNGFITFGGTVPGTTLYAPISGTTAYEGVISAFGRDINAAFVTDNILGNLSYDVVGSAPNREFVVQYRNFRPANSISTTLVPYINFQIRLSETSNLVTIVYGDSGIAVGEANTSTAAQIGLRGATNADFNNRTNDATVSFSESVAGTANANTQAYSSVDELPGIPANGLTYRWTPQTCFRPVNLSADGITTVAATIAWTAPAIAPSSGYEFYYSTNAANPEAGTAASGSVGAGVVSTTLSSLTPATTYYVWVRSKCDAGTVSGWSLAKTFTTLCISPTITATTPGAVCGSGAATLGVTTSSGFQSWYAAETGGDALAFGPTFTTPSISATTNFYVASESINAGTTAVGLGATTTTDSPFDIANGGYGGMKGQYIFTASELRTAGLRAGTINSLAVEFTTAGAALDGFTVQMGTTALSQFPTPVNIIGDLTTVFEPNVVTPTVGVNTIPLTTPFQWDGTSNIIVSTSWSNNNTSNNASTIKYDVLATYSSQSIRRDSQTAEFLLSLTGVQTSGSSQRGLGRPKVVFGASQVVTCSSPRVAVAATVTPAPALTLSTNTVNICQGATSAVLTLTSSAADYNSFVWSPATGVAGDAATGWQFNPTISGIYKLTATQTSGAACVGTATVTVNVAGAPSPIALPATTATCPGTVVALSATGGLGNVTYVDEAFTGSTTLPANWTATPGAGDTITIVNAATAGGTANELKIVGNSQTAIITNRVAIGPFNTAGVETLTLSWRNYVNHYSSTYPYSVGVQTSTDGIEWHDTSWLTSPVTVSQPAGQQSTVINTTDVGSGTFYVAFTMTGRTFGIHNWNIDEVKLEGASSAGISWSPIANLYSDAAGTIPYVANANATTVYFKSALVQETAYTATSTNAASCSVSATTTVTVGQAAAPTGAAAQTFAPSNNPTVANLEAVGQNVQWFSSLEEAIVGNNPLASTTALATGVYYATQTVDGCRSAVLVVTVTVEDLATQAFGMDQLKAYPNPVVNVFTLKYTKNITSVEVYNMIGQRVLAAQPNATVATLNMEQLPTATYIVQVKAGQESKTIKVVKN